MAARRPVLVKHPGLIPAEQALKLVLETARPIGHELVPMGKAAGRVLAKDLKAKRTQPPFAASAMDGYAVRHQDVITTPVRLRQIGQSLAGKPFDGKIAAGECVRIFTGAAVPKGADTIIIQENVKADGKAITILTGAEKGKFIRPAGLDFKKGQTLLRAGQVLAPQFLALAASMNHDKIPVFCRPKIAVFSTGDELVLPGAKSPLKPGQIIASNHYAVSAIAAEAGGDVINGGVAKDRLDLLTRALKKQVEKGADLIVTTGGASVGDHDLVLPALAGLGFKIIFSKLSIRPGKPLIFARGKIAGKMRYALGLAGNPVSSIVSSHIFMAPLIRLLGGFDAGSIQPMPALLQRDVPANDERQDFLRATARRHKDGSLYVAPFERQDSSMLAVLTRADCLIVRPANAPATKKGSGVLIIPLKRL